MVAYIGDFAEDATVVHYFNTFSSDDPAASVTISDLADADLFVYKDGSTTDIVTDGATIVIDFDSRTGIHKVTIDTSVHADYSTGSDYMVSMNGTTVDGGTITAALFTFSIENRFNAAADDLANGTDGLGAIKADTAAILLDTAEIGTAGAGLTDLGGMSTAMKAEVNAEADTALTDYDPPTNTEMEARTLVAASYFDPAADTVATVTTVSNTVSADVVSVSGDSGAADNLELMYDGTGYTDDTAPASRSQVSGIGTGGSGALNYPVAFDNSTTDTIDNAGAVDKGDGTVGIPVTGHAFVAGREVTIAGTTNYNGVYTIESQTTNEVVITETYAAETFGGSETIVSSIASVVAVGSTSSGTYATTESNPATHHQTTHAGNAIDLVYAVDCGATKTAIQAVINAYLTSSNDSINIQVYDHVGDDWETFSALSGTNGTTNTEVTLNLFEKHTSPIGASDAGHVYLRFVCTGQSSPVLNVATVVTSAVAATSTMGYEGGKVWSHEAAGTSTGTTLGVDGTFANQSDDFDNAQDIADSLGTSFINIHPGDSITLSDALEGYVISMVQATVTGGSQNVGSTRFNEGTYQGTFARSSGFPSFADGRLFGTSSLSLPQFVAFRCSVVGTLTLTEAANQSLIDCQAGGTATIDCGSLGSGLILNLVRWSGNVTFNNLASGAVVNLQGDGCGDVILNGADATVNIDGTVATVTNNLTGSPTVTDNSITLANINAEVDTAVSGIDGKIDTIDGIVDSILVDTGTTLDGKIDTIDSNVDSILADTGTDGVVIANAAISASTFSAGAIDAAALAADAVDEILDETIGDGTLTMRQTLRVLLAGMAGKLSGAATTTITIRNDADDQDVIVATVDASGNRTAVTVTP